MTKIIFWLSFLAIFSTYAGYPLILWCISIARRRDVAKRQLDSSISVILAAHNEEQNIKARIENLLRQDYDGNKFEIIVVSDGSTDGTEEIIRSFQEDRVTCLSLESRNGKAAALNAGIAKSRGEIIVFADSRQKFDRDAIRQLVANFSDPAVGCVSGELIFLESQESSIQKEMGIYWRYEKWIRKRESVSGSVIGATGAIYAIRRKLYRELPRGTLLDDVLIPMNIVMQGYRTVFDGTAIAYDIVSRDAGQEWHRKVRTLAGNWQLINLAPALFLPWRNPCWWRFMAHKICRLLVPFVLPAALVSGALLEGCVYKTATVGQVVLYLSAITGAIVPSLRRFRVVNLCFFFLTMNLAAAAGFWRWVTGGCATAWEPACRANGDKG